MIYVGLSAVADVEGDCFCRLTRVLIEEVVGVGLVAEADVKDVD